MGTQDRWWAVRVLYESSIKGAPTHTPRGQDAIFVVLAQDEAEAEAKGTEFAIRENSEFANPLGETVVIRFEQVTDIHDVFWPGDGDHLVDGTQVYMSLEAGSDMESLRQRGQMRPKPAK